MALKILVVDDETPALKLMKTVLEPLGHQVALFSDSREAARKAEKQKFDVVFVDYRMPHLDGFELTRRIRNSRPNSDTAIVMLTGAYDIDIIRRASREGVSFFLTKPFNPQRLSSLLTALERALWKEKRHFTRLPVRTTVSVRWDGEQLSLESLNISEGGMLLEPSGGLGIGQEISMNFSLPEVPASLKPRARVIRKEPLDSVVVEFINLMPADRKAIRRYIEGQLG